MPTGITSLINIGNGLAANDGTGDTLRTGAAAINANSAAIVTAINNLAASQSAGAVSYLTKADMDADLAHPDGTIALVTNDGTAANNQTWRKSGASGTGSWQITLDRIAAVLGNGSGFQQGGSGAVVQPFQQKIQEVSVSLTDFGADPTGVGSIATALDKAIQYLVGKGGGTIYGDGAHIYNLTSDYVITASNITIDFRGANLIGSGWLQFNGNSGVDGDWSKACTNVHFKNARIGSGSLSNTKMPFFLYCVDSSMENVTRDSASTSGMLMYMCKRTRFVGCRSSGGLAASGQIGLLMLHCIDSEAVDCHATGGPFIFGMEIKGGYGNTVRDCSLRDVQSSGSVVMQYGFMIRGDAPWSATGNGGLAWAYPYATGSWTTADSQRACWDCKVINCRVENCQFGLPAGQSAAAVFFAQEFIGGGFEGCAERGNTGSTTGMLVNRLVGGQEKDFSIVGNKSYGQPGLGMVVQSQDTVVMPGMLIADNLVEGCNSIGYQFTKVQGLVDRNQAYNVCAGAIAGHQTAFNFTAGCDLNVRGNRSIDTRGTPLVISAFADDRTCNYNIFAHNDAGVTSGMPIAVWSVVGRFTDNFPGEVFVQTTNATVNNGNLVMGVAVGQSKFVDVTVRGTDTAGNSGAWRVGALFTNNGGTLAQVGGTQQLMTAINPSAWGGVGLSAVGNTVRVSVTGKAGATINWVGNVRLT